MSRVFISHASEDKDEVARPLSCLLAALGHEVWFDEFSLDIGSALRESIDKGLSSSDFGVVILSHAFFLKDWPKDELEGLLSVEKRHSGTSGQKRKRILPVWHNVGIDDVEKFSPILAGRLGVSTSLGLDYVVKAIMATLATNRENDGFVSSSDIEEKQKSRFIRFSSPLGGEFAGVVFCNSDDRADSKFLSEDRLDIVVEAFDAVFSEHTHFKKKNG